MASREVLIKRYSVTAIRVDVELVSITDFEGEDTAIPDVSSEPFNELQRRIGLVMEALDCDEQYAQAVVLGRVKLG